jgi:outer membrane lipoprotein SlyB
MGAAPACRNCGVVQMVVAVHGYAQPQASGYQMHIRMDDGSMRMVQQRGALAAGSRVRVEGDSVRVLAQRSGQS